MKSEIEIAAELRDVRSLLAEYRANEWDDTMLYGAQQALLWALGRGVSPCELEETILTVAEDLERLASDLKEPA